MTPTAFLKRKYFSIGFISAGIGAVIGIFAMMPGSYATFQPKSIPIDWETEGLTLKGRYMNTKRNFKTFNPPGVLDTLEGLRFEASQFDSLINHNDKVPKYIMLYFGRNQQDVSGKGLFKRKYPSYTIMTIAVDSNNKLLKSMAFDKADPCPPNCPD